MAKTGTVGVVKRTRFLAKNDFWMNPEGMKDFQDNPEGTNDFP